MNSKEHIQELNDRIKELEIEMVKLRKENEELQEHLDLYIGVE